MKTPIRRYQLALLFSLLTLFGFSISAQRIWETLPASFKEKMQSTRRATDSSGSPGKQTVARRSSEIKTPTEIALDSAQATLAIPQNVLPGGGGRSTGGTLALDGTLGQGLAGGPLSGGSLSVSSGFVAGSVSNQCPTITVNNPQDPSGVIGTALSRTFTQTGGVGAVTFSLNSGTLPAGVTLATSGTLSGTPMQFGNFSITVKATDSNGCFGISTTYTLVISCQSLSVFNPAVANATVNIPFSQNFTQAGGIGAVTFSVNSGTLPSGLTLMPNGTLMGTPTQAGSFTFSVRVIDGNSCGVSGLPYTLVVTGGQVCSTIIINPASLPNGTLAVPYSQQLAQTGGAGAISWSLSSGSLPNGLSLNPVTGLISGTPTSFSLAFNFTVKVTDANGCMGTRSYQMAVSPCAPISISPASPDPGTVGIPYSLTLSSSGGTAPYTYVLQNGALPPGLTLTGAVISGTPTTPGSFNFTIQSNSSLNNCFALQNFTLTINPAVASNGLQFYPLTRPLRLLDTRPANQRPGGAFDTPGVKIAGLLSGGTDRVQQAQVSFDGLTIPAHARAIVGTATVVNFPGPGQYDGTGNVTFYPSNANRPEVSNLNYAANQTVSNGFTVALSNAGAFSIFSYSDVHLVVEVVGYYAAPTVTGLYFHPLPKPIRLLETRPQLFYTGCSTPRAPLTAGNVRTEQGRLTCSGVTIPAAAQALVGNLTAVNATANGLAMAYAGDQVSTPIATSLAYVTTQPIANAFVTRLGSDGTFKIAVSQTTDFLVDISGYYSTEATDVNGEGLLFTQLAHPIRLLETRAGFPGCYMTSAPLAAQSNRVQPAWGSCDGVTIPANARAIIGNVTAVTTTPTTQISFGSGNVTLYPSSANQPDVSNLNYTVNQNIPNAFTVRLNTTDGRFTIFVFDQIDLLIDVSGYFAP